MPEVPSPQVSQPVVLWQLELRDLVLRQERDQHLQVERRRLPVVALVSLAMRHQLTAWVQAASQDLKVSRQDWAAWPVLRQVPRPRHCVVHRKICLQAGVKAAVARQPPRPMQRPLGPAA